MPTGFDEQIGYELQALSFPLEYIHVTGGMMVRVPNYMDRRELMKTSRRRLRTMSSQMSASRHSPHESGAGRGAGAEQGALEEPSSSSVPEATAATAATSSAHEFSPPASSSATTANVEVQQVLEQVPRVGFFWSWNYMLTSRWRTKATGDDFALYTNLQDLILLDMRFFCANSRNRLVEFFDQWSSSYLRRDSLSTQLTATSALNEIA